MKYLRRLGLVGLASVGLLLPTSMAASAADFTPSASIEIKPRSGSLFNNAFKTSELVINTGVSAPASVLQILPTLSADLSLPSSSQLTFNPGNMPVCPDDKIGPSPVDVEVPVDEIVKRCPNSIVGNGTATFLLGRNNKPDDPRTQLIGQVLVFNGGLREGQPRVKFWAYSYDTSAGIYTEAILQPDGTFDIPLPVLSSDSAVNRLDVVLPSKKRDIFLENQGINISLPGGQKADYVKAKCDTGTFPFSADFSFGRRIYPTGQRINPEQDVTINDVGEPISCTGVRATAKLGKVTVKGPAKAKRNKATTYSVTIRNSGGLSATSVRLAIAGRGVRLSSNVGTIAGESSRTVKIKAKFKNPGKIKAKFNVSSKNGGKASASRTITVR